MKSCQYAGYFYHSESLNWAACGPQVGHSGPKRWHSPPTNEREPNPDAAADQSVKDSGGGTSPADAMKTIEKLLQQLPGYYLEIPGFLLKITEPDALLAAFKSAHAFRTTNSSCKALPCEGRLVRRKT